MRAPLVEALDDGESVDKPLFDSLQELVVGLYGGAMSLSSTNDTKTSCGVALAGFGLGVLTAYAQLWLPEEVGSLANSSGTWCLIAVGLAFLARTERAAAAFGALSLMTLLIGYVSGAAFRDFPSSRSLIIFWGFAAIVVGPFLGLAAHWIKTRKPIYDAVGAGGICGLLIGEGIYGLVEIADTTYPPYWWSEIIVGAGLLVWASARLRQPRLVATAIGVAIFIAAAFLAIYRLNLIGFLS